MTTVLRLQNLVKRFGSATAVDDISIDVSDGEFLALLGPSGCGKTTLLRMLGGFEQPNSGRVWMDGNDITNMPPNKRPVNMLFQSYAIFPHMSVRDNVGYGLRVVGVAREEIHTRVDEALALARMSEYADRMPDNLSGGQRQRVALARALIKKPRVLLLDEPLSALDAKLRELMQAELVKLQNSVGITFIVVTHDQDEALSMAGRVAVMKDGKILQIDTPRNLYEAPQSRFVADFIGRMNIFTARHLQNNLYEAEGLGTVAAADENPAAAYIAIRPAYITTTTAESSAANTFVATLGGISYYGGETILTVQTEKGATLTVVRPNQNRNAPAPALGEKIAIKWLPQDVITLTE